MIKNIVLTALLLSSVLQAQVIDVKQLFNKTTTKVKKEEVSINKSFYGVTKVDESTLTDIVSRFDGYITKLYANNKYMTIMSAQQKEDRLFENIYLSYFPKMKRFAQEYVISEQDAENIVQDMFAELWEKREMFTCQTIRIAYLFTIIKNKCLNHLRHKTIALETINNMLTSYIPQKLLLVLQESDVFRIECD